MEDCGAVFKLLFLISLSVHLSSADTHSLQFLYTLSAVTPEFTGVGLLDGEQCMYYKSDIGRMILKTEWIQKFEDYDLVYWIMSWRIRHQQNQIQETLASAMQSFTQPEGGHVLQSMFGCQLDKGTTTPYMKFGNNGEDFFHLDVKTGTWTADKVQAESFIKNWDPEGDQTEYWKDFLDDGCIDLLGKFVSYGKETLERKVRPEVSLFHQERSSFPKVVCHATGFFPKALNITWQKDGKDVSEHMYWTVMEVELSETLPNHDGSFQKRSVLKVLPNELLKHKYTCVIQHSSLEEDLVLPVSELRILRETHSLEFLYTAVTPGINFTEFTGIGLVDGEQSMYYKSDIRTMIAQRQQIESFDETFFFVMMSLHIHHQQDRLQDILISAVQNFTQPEGGHVLQVMFGCQLDKGTTTPYMKFGYNGEDFFHLDVKTGAWTADKHQAEIFINNWESAWYTALYWNDFLEDECIDWLWTFVSYDRETLERKVRPEVSLFQKHSPSPEVVCHATGFFPKALNITWQKDGRDLFEDVDLSETLPNHDGSFQKRSVLKVSAEELQKHKYTCVIQHSSLEEDLVLPVRETHTLQYLYTSKYIRGGIYYPEFTIGLVDGEQFIYYDSNITTMIPKTEWIQKIKTSDPAYWNRETWRIQRRHWRLQDVMDLAHRRFHPTEGDHVLQLMYGCDDISTTSYMKFGYNGEDFFHLDLKTGAWTKDEDKAELIIKDWDPEGYLAKYWKNYLETHCIDWLNKVMSYGRETLERKVRPEVSLFQKHSPSPEVVCHATGFFPKELNFTWQKDGRDLFEDVELSETLPNQDGSFQKRSVLKVSAEELQKHKYTCVIQHSSLEEELVLPVSEQRNLKDGGSGGAPIGIIIGVVVLLAVVFLITVIALTVNAGYLIRKKMKKKKTKNTNDKENESDINLRALTVRSDDCTSVEAECEL